MSEHQQTPTVEPGGDGESRAPGGVPAVAWVPSTYFAEGYPYSIVHQLADVLYKEMGASLATIGLTSLFHLPWNLKFLWGPMLDAFATKRAWLVATEVAISGVVVLMALLISAPNVLAISAVLFTVLAVLAATHDVAIDGYYLEALDEDGQSRYVGFRAMAYRVAMWFVSAPIIWLIARVGWTIGFLAVALIMMALTAFHAFALPRVETPKKPWRLLWQSVLRLRTAFVAGVVAAIVLFGRWAIPTADAVLQSAIETTESPGLKAALESVAKISAPGWIALALLAVLGLVLALLPKIRRSIDGSDSFYAQAFVSFLDQDRVGLILGFVIFFRTGESFLQKMRYPFLRDLSMSMEQYAFAHGTVGLWAGIVATLLGGWLISKHGLGRWIWPFVIAQNVLNLLYCVIAYRGGPIELSVVTALIGAEAFGAGLGTSVFMVYLMRCCRPDYKAAHMAIVTALMSVSFTFAGVASGFLASWLGYTGYFGFTFVATIPGMLLIPFIPHVRSRPAGPATA